MNFQKDPVLVVGEEETTFSIAVCLLQAKHPVTLLTRNRGALKIVNEHLSAIAASSMDVPDSDALEISDLLEGPQAFRLAIVVTSENLQIKQSCIRELEAVLSNEALIAVNTESIPLSEIQEIALVPERIIGANWVEPAYTTFFLEIISNEKARTDLVNHFHSTARSSWHKDPYVLHNDNGIRSRMMCAMIREAFYLVENQYVSIEDIDRACRNDPGYYLPFSGHCRYMDLMGAYVYGEVMKDLNPELSNSSEIAPFFIRIMEDGGEGLQNRKGLYAYEPDEVRKRTEEFRKFSFEIREIISKYPAVELKKPVDVRKTELSKL